MGDPVKRRYIQLDTYSNIVKKKKRKDENDAESITRKHPT